MGKTISMIVAHSENNIIGKDNKLLWNIPSELQHFKAKTLGKTIVMGRKTFESIGRALPGRTNVVVTRDQAWSADKVVVAHSIQEAINVASTDEVVIIGGGQLYAEALPITDILYRTIVHASYDGDTTFPDINRDEWSTVDAGYCKSIQDQPAYTVTTLIRKRVG